jgi:hypothetical protein
MRAFSLIMDIVLIAIAIGIVLYMRGMGGAIGRSLSLMTAGIVILGLAHILETMTFELLHWDTDLVELTHRFVVLAGFIFVFFGFQRIAKLR